MANIEKKSWLTFIKYTANGKRYSRRAFYRCICGTVKEIGVANVVHFKTISCGCYARRPKENISYHPLRSVYDGIKTRCYNKNDNYFYLYGGNGVTMCDEWFNSYRAFYEWSLANGYKKGLRIDKDIIPMKLGIDTRIYSPEMCCWVTVKENSNATKWNRFIEYNGETKTLGQWSEYFNVEYTSFRYRMRISGWSVENYINNKHRWRT